MPTTDAFAWLTENQLYTSGEYMPSGGQIPGNVSADMMVVSDPYLRATPNQYQYSQQGQIVQQMPGEFNERW